MAYAISKASVFPGNMPLHDDPVYVLDCFIAPVVK